MTAGDIIDGMPPKRCGIAGCKNPVVPSAFVEGRASFDDDLNRLVTVRVEVCLAHYDMLSVGATRGLSIG